MLVPMAPVDYYHDPDAPKANSVVPSTTVAVRDDAGRLLLIHKVDNDLWALPGGGMDLGESIADAAVREVAEETGLAVELTGLVGIYTDPGHVMAYDDGEVRQEFRSETKGSVRECFKCAERSARCCLQSDGRGTPASLTIKATP